MAFAEPKAGIARARQLITDPLCTREVSEVGEVGERGGELERR